MYFNFIFKKVRNLLVLSILISFCVSSFFVLDKFMNKELRKDVSLAFHFNDKAEEEDKEILRIVALSILNKLKACFESGPYTFSLEESYIKDISIFINKSSFDNFESVDVMIGSYSGSPGFKQNIDKREFTQDSKDRSFYVFKFDSNTILEKSMFPFFNNILNWVGDYAVFMIFLEHFIRVFCFVGILLLLLLLTFDFTLIYIKEFDVLFKNNISDKFYTKGKYFLFFREPIVFKEKMRYMILFIWHKLRYLFFNKNILVLFAVFSIINIVYIFIVQKRMYFDLSLFYNYSFFFQKLILDFLFWIICASFLFKIFKRFYIPAIFSVFFILLNSLNLAIYYFGSTLFEQAHMRLITFYSIKSFFSIGLIFIIFIFVLVSVLATYYLIKNIKVNTWKKTFDYFVVFLSLTLINIPLLFANMHINTTLSSAKRDALRIQTNQMQYALKNSMFNFFQEMFFKKYINKFFVTTNYNDFSDTIEKYALPVGKREYADLNLKPFNRIILFASESISLDLLSGYNPKIPMNEKSFYWKYRDRMFLNFRTSNTPTLQGISVVFNSHPNFDLLVQGYKTNYQNSFAKILKQEGFKTVFLRSASRYYAGENKYFTELGFNKIIGSEDFIRDNKKYVYEWGVCDRIMYEKLVDIIEVNRNNKLFITILGTDTHPLEGRIDYKDLKYPDFNINLNFPPGEAFLRAMNRHDYDMKLFIDELVSRNLIDENTLIIFTADHACPLNNVVNDISGFEKTNLGKIPLLFYANQKLPDVNYNIKASQLDLAPTILHLLDLEIPSGYWGDSLFSSYKKEQYIGVNKGFLIIENNDTITEINNDNLDDKDEEKLFKFFNTLILDTTD